jgi:hypothetical protein
LAAWTCGCAAQSHRHSTAGVHIGRPIPTAPSPASSRTTPALPHPPSRVSEPDPAPPASAVASAERPARRFFHSYVSRVVVTPAGPPLSALATATVLAGRARYRLTVILEPRGNSWLVVALDP